MNNKTLKIFPAAFVLFAAFLVFYTDTACARIAPSQYFVKSEDNWRLSVSRYWSKGAVEHREPVVLCHGFNFNNRMWDLDKEHSLARYLAERGYDVWSVNLRGSGDSSKPALSSLRSISKLELIKIPWILLRAPGNITKTDWTIDDHINKDIPALLKFVKDLTGKDKVTWIGHSMGSMIMYAYLVTGQRSDIKNFVAIGGMVSLKEPANNILARIASQEPITHASLLINTTLAYQLRNLTLGTIKLPWENLFYNKENMDRATIIRMFRLSIDDTSPGVIKQFGELIKSGSFMSADGKINYTERLGRIKVPILILGGTEARLSTINTMRYAYENISSSDKTLHIFSKENGYSADYGHCDLILGRNAESEVYGYIADWIDKR